MKTVISVIIPTLNEERLLPATLDRLAGVDGCEVIVSDGGSSDATTKIAKGYGCILICGPPGRGRQMNAGAALARGRILLFLHADTTLPANFAEKVENALLVHGVVGGAFSLKIAGGRWSLAAIAFFANLRSRLLQLPYGDQALFTEARTFHSLGGFPEMPIMEDAVFVRRLAGLGRILILPEAAITSARRWEHLGVLRTTLINQLILIGYGCGVPATTLVGWYRRLRGLTREEG
jgi:rSAM/selenodomain-associated transferase 2